MYQTPVKSSLSEVRGKVSFEFFREFFADDLAKFNRVKKTFRGYEINAVDGSDLDLPASKDILKAGHRGALWSKEFETHYPKMFVVHAYDVINGTVSVFKHSTINSERALTRDIAFGFKRKSLTIYDRLFCGHPTFKSHIEAGNLFLVRAWTQGLHVPLCVQEFVRSDKVDQEVIWKPKKLKKSEGLLVRLVKIKNPKTNETNVFATNAPRKLFSRIELGQLYLKRWEIESSFRDLVSTLKMDQWHTTKINGILQEIYCLLWIANAVKMQMESINTENAVLARVYTKSNFKFCVRLVMENIGLLIRGKKREFFEIIDHWIRKTREKRKHRSRSYPRVVRTYGTGFCSANKVSRRSRDL